MTLDIYSAEEIEKLEPEDFFERVDMAGPFMQLELLETFVDRASEKVRQFKDYTYLVGLLYGRMIHEYFGGI